MNIEEIKARAEVATPIVLIGAMVSKNNAEFLKNAKADVLALLAEVEHWKSEAETWEMLRKDADRIREGLMQKELNLIGKTMRLESENAQLSEQLAAMQKQLDAAMSDLKSLDCHEPYGGMHCTSKDECYKYVREHGGNFPECEGCGSWQWRGTRAKESEHQFKSVYRRLEVQNAEESEGE